MAAGIASAASAGIAAAACAKRGCDEKVIAVAAAAGGENQIQYVDDTTWYYLKWISENLKGCKQL